MIDPLMADRSRYMPTIKIILQLTGITFVMIAASRPYIHTNSDTTYQTEEETVKGIEVMICCDLSNSMLASSTADVKGISRLQRAKYLLDKALDNMSNDRVGLVVFAGNAYLQLPISPDIQAAKMLINGLSTGIIPFQGTAIGAAIDMSLNAFDPESSFSKTILLITDGENFEDDAIAAAKKAAESDVQVNVIGIGSAGNPMPVPVAEGSDQYIEYNGSPA
ncbi:MAG: VWA domain-containing protein, partial [Paramuribaculum sp.]|nr:VWA domain-containing protein [Paramuribaculum sp.]